MHKINLREKLGLFGEHWRPKIVGGLNGQFVKLVKFQGEFVWHHHEHEDELFLVVSGRFRMDFRDRQEWVEEGDLIIVPRGVEHRPFAQAGSVGFAVRARVDAEHWGSAERVYRRGA